jgi:proteic killer suppression protein
MEIGGFDHKGLKRLYEDDDSSKVDSTVADKLRLMLAFLQDMATTAELLAPPRWKAHPLTGDARGACL